MAHPQAAGSLIVWDSHFVLIQPLTMFTLASVCLSLCQISLKLLYQNILTNYIHYGRANQLAGMDNDGRQGGWCWCWRWDARAGPHA